MRSEIKRWFEQGVEDLKTAEVNLQGKRYYAAVFFCQQSAEKMLKGVYIKIKGKSPGPTHSLTYLGRELNLSKDLMEFLRSLTVEYYISRYPDATEDLPSKIYTENDAKKYIKVCEDILSWAKLKLNL